MLFEKRLAVDVGWTKSQSIGFSCRRVFLKRAFRFKRGLNEVSCGIEGGSEFDANTRVFPVQQKIAYTACRHDLA